MSTVFGEVLPPGSQRFGDNSAYNLGTVIRCNVAGNITALRTFVTAYHDSYAGTFRLYVDGNYLPPVRSVAYNYDHANYSSWVEVNIEPYHVDAGALIMAAYTTPGFYTATSGFFNTSDKVSDDGFLTAPASVVFGGVSANGRFNTSPDATPDQSYNRGCYFADVRFVSDSSIPPLPIDEFNGTDWNHSSRSRWDGVTWKDVTTLRYNGSVWQ